MAWHLIYYNDVLARGALARLAPAKRLLYVFAGSMVADGKVLTAGEGLYGADALGVAGGPDGATIFRWDLGEGDGPGLPAAGDGVASLERLRREIWSLDLKPGTRWLLRLDVLTNPAGVTADLHTHVGPGMRALISGTFSVRQTSEDATASEAGDPWWETGVEAVRSTPSADRPSSFARVMILPPDYRGRPTVTWLRGAPALHSERKVLVEEIVAL